MKLAIRRFQHLAEFGPDREAGLWVLDVPRTTLVTLTEHGRDLLDVAQDRSLDDCPQRFYAGFARRPDMTHDAHFHQAYEQAAQAIREREQGMSGSCSMTS